MTHLETKELLQKLYVSADYNLGKSTDEDIVRLYNCIMILAQVICDYENIHLADGIEDVKELLRRALQDET